MRSVTHTLRCSFGPDECPSSIAIEIHGEHDLRSVSQMLEDVALLAGWMVERQPTRHWCSQHGPGRPGDSRSRPRCDCDQRNGIKHGIDCPLVKVPT